MHGFLDAFRYTVALAEVLMVPGALLYWFSIHPFVGFWGKVGIRRTLAIHMAGAALLAWLLFLIRGWLLAVDFGFNPVLAGVSVPLFVFSVRLRKRLARHLTLKTLTGFPELDPARYPSGMLTEGIYSRIRHPRYLEIAVALLAYALLTNYLAAYLLFVLGCLALLAIVRWEERELRQRFGAEYEAYCARVPRFIPRRERR